MERMALQDFWTFADQRLILKPWCAVPKLLASLKAAQYVSEPLIVSVASSAEQANE